MNVGVNAQDGLVDKWVRWIGMCGWINGWMDGFVWMNG